MSRPVCAWWPEIGRTVRPGSDPRLAGHLEGCADCREGLQQLARAVAALEAAPYAAPDSEAREQARTRLIATISRAGAPRPAGRLWVKTAVTVAASLCGATVLAAVGARVLESHREAALVESPADGPGRARGRRGRVARGAPAPVEEPASEPAHMEEAAPAPLAEAAPVVAPAPVAPPPSPADEAPVRTPAPAARSPFRARPIPIAAPPTPMPAVNLTPPARAATPAEVAFARGWEALRTGDHRGAAAHLEAALALGQGGSLDEDARYWRAVALGRAGAAGDARAAMQQFLRRHPGSARAGEVSAMLGWLLVDAGELGAARAAFRAAEGDASPAVRKSARAGLDLVGAD